MTRSPGPSRWRTSAPATRPGSPSPTACRPASTGASPKRTAPSPARSAARSSSCTVGSLGVGASKTYQVTGTTDKADCGVINNTGIASATNEPSDKLANNSDSGSVEVKCADIQIEKTADDEIVSAGEQIGFDIVVTNDGNGTAKNVTVTDTLPTDAGLSWTIESVSGDGSPSCSITSGVLTCTSAALGAGESFTVHIVSPTTSASCGVVDNTASVVAGNDGSDSDDATVTVQCPDVTVVKTADNSPINAGDTAAFTITVSNAGPGEAKGVTLSDPLPAGIAWSEDSADCSITNNTLNCNFGDLPAGASGNRVVHVTGLTDAADCKTLPNTATVAATNEAAAQGGNNTSSASIVVECPNISVVKTGNGPISAGQTATFTIVLSNAGPGDAYGVTLTDQLPSGDWTLGGADAGACSDQRLQPADAAPSAPSSRAVAGPSPSARSRTRTTAPRSRTP